MHFSIIRIFSLSKILQNFYCLPVYYNIIKILFSSKFKRYKMEKLLTTKKVVKILRLNSEMITKYTR